MEKGCESGTSPAAYPTLMPHALTNTVSRNILIVVKIAAIDSPPNPILHRQR